MKQKIINTLVLASITMSTQAATLAYDNATITDGSGVTTSTSVTGTISTAFASSGTSGSVTYQVVGTDIGGITGLNQVNATINFLLVNDGGDNLTIAGSNGLGAGGNGELSTNSQGITFSAGSIVTNLGAGVSSTFNGFTELFLAEGAGAPGNTGNYGGSDRHNLDVDNNAQDVTAGDANNTSDRVSFDASSMVTIQHNDSGGGGGFSVRTYDFSIDVLAVPEPSSVTLLGLGGLALILHRRK